MAFAGTSDAIKAEQALVNAGLHVRVMNLPSSIRAGCGICLRLGPDDYTTASRLLNAAGVAPQGVYERHPSPTGSTYLPVKNEATP